MMNFTCKCKAFLAIAVPFCCVYGEIPLEWNINNKVNVPYELEIDRKKIADIADIAVDHTYKVTATANGKKTDLQTVLLPGQENNKVTLRFTVPEGTTSLSCTPVNKKGIIAEASSCGNIFAQALQTPENWKIRNGKLIRFAADFVDCAERGLLSRLYLNRDRNSPFNPVTPGTQIKPRNRHGRNLDSPGTDGPYAPGEPLRRGERLSLE